MLGTILVCIIPIITILVIVGVVTWCRKEKVEGIVYLLVGYFVIVVLIASFLPATVCYGDMLSLPYKYEAACNTYEETLELLMRFDNITVKSGIEGQLGSIGQGLESQWLKQRLNEAIEYKNNLWAEIKACQINPWQPFRYLLDGVDV